MPVGTVVAFDQDRGRGEVESDRERLGFHSTKIVDGSRSVAVGATVEFELAPGHLGRWEAVNLRPVTR